MKVGAPQPSATRVVERDADGRVRVLEFAMGEQQLQALRRIEDKQHAQAEAALQALVVPPSIIVDQAVKKGTDQSQNVAGGASGALHPLVAVAGATLIIGGLWYITR